MSDRPDELGKGEGQHREEDAGEPDAEETNDSSCRRAQHNHRSEDGGEGPLVGRPEDGDAIGADGKVGSMTEGDQPAESHHEIEGEGEESKDKDLGEEIDDPPFADERHKGEKCDDERKGDWLRP